MSEIVEAVASYLSNQIIHKGTIRAYHIALNELKSFCNNFYGNLCDIKVIKVFLEKAEQAYRNGNKSKSALVMCKRVCRAAEEFLETGEVSYKLVKSSHHRQLNSTSSEIIQAFEDWLKQQYRSVWTIIRYISDARQILYYVEDSGISSLSELNSSIVSDFLLELSNRRAHPGNTIWGLKAFFQYLMSESLIDSSVLKALDLKSPCHTKVYLGFSESECQAIFDAVDRTTATGKRDYAMMLLAKDTGLRSEDIRKLMLHDIDWHNSEISVVQSKTQKPLVLYLTDRVGNAIAEYILNGRPESEAREVFLKAKRPFTRIINRPGIVQKYVKLSGIQLNEHVKLGFHAFRRKLGTALLDAEVPLPTAGEMLGQVSLNSMKPYIAVDIDHLKLCAMPMSEYLSMNEECL